MNTNYEKWDKFDVDEELEEVERNSKAEEFKIAKMRQMRSTLALEEERQRKALQEAKREAKGSIAGATSGIGAIIGESSSDSASKEEILAQVDTSTRKDKDIYADATDADTNLGSKKDAELIFHLRYSINFDKRDIPMRMIMISTAITDIIHVVRALQSCLDSYNFTGGYLIGRKAIVMISEVVEFLNDTRPLVENSEQFPVGAGGDGFISCMECSTPVLPSKIQRKPRNPRDTSSNTSSSSSQNAKRTSQRSANCCSNCETVLPSVVIQGSASVPAPDGNTSSFDGSVASVLKLRTVTITLTAQTAFYMGELAVATELSRCAIKLRQEEHEAKATKMKIIETDDVTMWVIRGGAFALMGNPYLALSHFRQVKSLLPDFPGIDELLRYVEEVEERNYANFLPLSEESLDGVSGATISWQYRLQKDIKALTFLWVRNHSYYRKLQESTLRERKRSVKLNLPVDVELLKRLVDEKCDDNVNDLMENLYERVGHDMKQCLEMITKIFYEGQMLFLEQMYHSAEAKFIMSLAMIIMYLYKKRGKSLSITEIISTCDENDKYLRGMKVACLVNIAKSRLQRHQAKSWKTCPIASDVMGDSYEGILKFVIDINAIDLCDFALSNESLLWHDKVSILLTKLDILQSMKKYEECLHILEMIRHGAKDMNCATSIEEIDEKFLIVRGYEDDTLYTQKFICGMSLAVPKQHDSPEATHANIELTFHDKLVRKIENRKNRIEYLQRTRK